jgi:hypothetical protein
VSQTTHRLLNRLWTRTYRNGRGMKKGDVLPMEQDVVFLVSRATSQEYELLFEWAQVLAYTLPSHSALCFPWPHLHRIWVS